MYYTLFDPSCCVQDIEVASFHCPLPSPPSRPPLPDLNNDAMEFEENGGVLA